MLWTTVETGRLRVICYLDSRDFIRSMLTFWSNREEKLNVRTYAPRMCYGERPSWLFYSAWSTRVWEVYLSWDRANISGLGECWHATVNWTSHGTDIGGKTRRSVEALSSFGKSCWVWGERCSGCVCLNHQCTSKTEDARYLWVPPFNAEQEKLKVCVNRASCGMWGLFLGLFIYNSLTRV